MWTVATGLDGRALEGSSYQLPLWFPECPAALLTWNPQLFKNPFLSFSVQGELASPGKSSWTLCYHWLMHHYVSQQLGRNLEHWSLPSVINFLFFITVSYHGTAHNLDCKIFGGIEASLIFSLPHSTQIFGYDTKSA